MFHERYHYLAAHRNARMRPEYTEFREWLDVEVSAMMRGWQGVDAGIEAGLSQHA
ncbi:hypothetical protein [Burkholderia sp. Ac-20365]|uniref:hypothetical protein n=1 Tax=Burkholderia sp. Ac-20365 TaxID=2703897 RepID=UPI00197B6383|nr:hypothetical protein [Burkholderia sp. Ac-20365]